MKPRTIFLGTALVSATALAIALVSQHLYGMQPCPWCVLQRLLFVLIGAAGAMGAWAEARPAKPAARRGTALAAAVVFVLGASGIGAALWQHFVAASTTSCDRTVADRIMSGLGLDMAWPEVFAPFASCADAKVNLLGVPYEFFSLALFVLMAAGALNVLRRRRQPMAPA